MTEIEEWQEHRNKRSIQSVIHIGCDSIFPALCADIEENVALLCADEQSFWASKEAKVYHPGLEVDTYLRVRSKPFDMVVIGTDLPEIDINDFYRLVPANGLLMGKGEAFKNWVRKNRFITSEGEHWIAIMPSLF